MNDPTLRLVVLKVLNGQHPDYWIHPNATAFMVQKLSPFDVQNMLEELRVEGQLERETLDPENGVNAGGYRLIKEPA